ncbi:MAG: histidinol-phosphatase [Oscillospiraceae bacterium]|nr:histidinol-phosphatase [Oscillospiraceae bacterium]
MIANYHTHTPRCHHATGAERKYVENAIARGLQIFGFSDHTPQYFPGSYYSYMRMFPEELDDYCNDVRALQTEFAGKIEIPLGVEAEYYPVTWKEMLLRLQDAGVEYMLLGQHWINNEYDAPSHATAPTEDVSHLIAHCNQVITALETGKFTYIAHPDFLNFVGDPKIYQQQMQRICKASIDTDTPLEINLLGVREHRHYPNLLFWEIAAQEGCKVVLGMDAHSPNAITNTQQEADAMKIVQDLGLNLLQTVPIKHI